MSQNRNSKKTEGVVQEPEPLNPEHKTLVDATIADVLLEEDGEESEIEQKVSYTQYCVFNAGKEEYAIPIAVVKEVVKYSMPAPLPQMPPYIVGMSNIRGNIYGVMDLEMFFTKTMREESQYYLLVLDHDTFKMTIRISNVPNSIIVSDQEVEGFTSNALKTTSTQSYIKGIIKKDKRMIIVLDIIGVVSSENFTKIEF